MPPLFVPYNPSADSSSVTYKTHLNYIKCMQRLTANLAIQITSNLSGQLDSQKIAKFEKLAAITKTSIQGEKNACDNERAYAQIAAPWIPVKCYYRLYYLESVFIYLLNSSTIGFVHGGHTGIRNAVKSALNGGSITLSPGASELETRITWVDAASFRTASGSTLRMNYHTTPECTQSLRKKLSEYIEIDWKQKNNIQNYRSLAARQKKAAELSPKTFELLDYFYWMRIKANYRDVDFLDFDNEINEHDAFEYLTSYIESAENYALALENSIAQIKIQRHMPTS